MASPAREIATAIEQAQRVADMYADAEQVLLQRIAARVADGVDQADEDLHAWEAARLAELVQLRKEAERIIGRLQRAAKAAARKSVLGAWAAGMDQAVINAVLGVHDAKVRKRLEQVLRDARRLGSEKLINPGQGVDELARQTIEKIAAVELAALRAVDDIYRQVIAETAGRALTGAQTRREAAQEALARLAARGVTGIGPPDTIRRWNLESYVEMAMRTATARAAVDGHLATLRDAGIDLVIVSTTPYSCSRCDPWEGKVLSQRGRSGDREEVNLLTNEPVTVRVTATVEQARLAGLLHPGCRHSLSAYLPGVTRAAAKPATSGSYDDTQQVRRRMRQAREWERRAAAALTPEAKKKALATAREYRADARRISTSKGLPRPR
ncbi:phage minor capsid protein [Nonomuraea sp. NPDC051191]|uniref:phage minor capsid protein n=1 Tax=Nonomuraea sp. NPDC051191 TaxID=3364372 RepID=UPI0037AF0B4D